MDYSLLVAVEKAEAPKDELHMEPSSARFGLIENEPSSVSKKESKLKQSILKSLKGSNTNLLSLEDSKRFVEQQLISSTNSLSSHGSVAVKVDVGEWMSTKHRF